METLGVNVGLQFSRDSIKDDELRRVGDHLIRKMTADKSGTDKDHAFETDAVEGKTASSEMTTTATILRSPSYDQINQILPSTSATKLHHRRHQRNFSDSVCATSGNTYGECNKRMGMLSVGNLSNDESLDDNWQKFQERLVNARIQDREESRDIERENMHLYLSEMLISAFEQMKWRRESESILSARNQNERTADSAANESDQFADSSSSQSSSTTATTTASEFGEHHTGSSTFYTSIDDYKNDNPTQPNRRDEKQIEIEENENNNSCEEESAEAIASSLLRQFTTNRPTQIDASDVQWLVSYADAPQMLLPMPTGTMICDDELDSEGRAIRFRGSSDWAPPRKQWIFTVRPFIHSVSRMMELQKNRCAGCGIKVNRLYARRMRYCNYYGKMFCQRCHQGSKIRIPARIIQEWNFKQYAVSDMAERFLLDNYSQPVINASAVDPHFYVRVRRLRQLRILRTKLVHLWPFIRLCPITDRTVTKYGNLRSMFTSIPKHILCDADAYSMADLENARNGDMVRLIEPLVRYGQYHVLGCERCSARAFVCELCDERDELLFPFQTDKVYRCDSCGSLSHSQCASKRLKHKLPCPKCVRIAVNSERHRRHSVSSIAPPTLDVSNTAGDSDDAGDS